MTIFQNIVNSNYFYQPGWMAVFIILSVVITGYLFSAFHSRFVSVLRSFFTMRFASQMAREEYSLTHPVSVFLSINFLITAPLFILQFISSGMFTDLLIENPFSYLLATILIVALIYFIKIIGIKILGFIFKKSALANEYTFTIFLVNQIIGIALVPVIIFIAYGAKSFSGPFIYTGLILLVLAFIIRVGKGIFAVVGSGSITLFYLFLYLCTLEILPLLLGFKLLEKLV